MHRLLVGLVAAGWVACAPPPPPEPPGPPPPPRIYAVADGGAISERELVAASATARFVLLGETHDNPEHHRLQARLLERLLLAGREPAVAFEMLPVELQAAVDEVLAGPEPSARALREAVAWDASGWPAFELYAPVFETAIAASLPIVAADLGQVERQALRDPGSGVGARLGLDEALPTSIRAALERDIVEAHCGHATPEMLPAMVRVQRARDARLAQSLLEASGGEDRPVVLITGAEHARLDRGVPRSLARLAPGADVVSFAFLEVPAAGGAGGEGAGGWTALEARYDGAPPFDYVWLTEPEPREDPCEEFEEALRKMGR